MALDYPDTMQEFIDQFTTEESCRAYIAQVRWGAPFVCSHCAHTKHWQQTSGALRCAACRKDIHLTAGTVFQDSRTPLRTWFMVLWFLVSQKQGISALGLMRLLGIKHYDMVWEMLSRIRTRIALKQRDKLAGVVEVDEVFIGGVKPGKPGRSVGGKTLVLVAVEDCGKPTGMGRIRMMVIADASATTLTHAVQAMVEPGSTICTDKWAAYPALTTHGYTHVPVDRLSALGEDPTPLVHRIASLLKRWLLGTHHGRVEVEHLPQYLAEFTFRFNRRKSASRGKLFYRLMQDLVK
jgi:transposase-like protein